jgi:hypothetical protein
VVSLEAPKGVFCNQVLVSRNVGGTLKIARKECRPDEWDPPIPVYDPYGPGEADAFVDDSCCAQRD